MYFMFFFIPDELKKKIKNEDKNKKFKDVAYIWESKFYDNNAIKNTLNLNFNFYLNKKNYFN